MQDPLGQGVSRILSSPLGTGIKCFCCAPLLRAIATGNQPSPGVQPGALLFLGWGEKDALLDPRGAGPKRGVRVGERKGFTSAGTGMKMEADQQPVCLRNFQGHLGPSPVQAQGPASVVTAGLGGGQCFRRGQARLLGEAVGPCRLGPAEWICREWPWASWEL